MKKLLLTSLIALAGLALVACTDKTTNRKTTPSTTKNKGTNKIFFLNGIFGLL